MTVWHGVAVLAALSFQARPPQGTDQGLVAQACSPTVQTMNPLTLSDPPTLASTDALTVFSCKNNLAQSQFLQAINAKLNAGNYTPLPTQPGQASVDDECVVLLTDTQKLKITNRYWVFRFKLPPSTREHTVIFDQLGQVDEANDVPFHALSGY